MSTRKNPPKKQSLHPRNKHQAGYDFKKLTAVCPALFSYVFQNKYGTTTIDFAKPKAVKLLNKALLHRHYQIEHWNIPEGYLCPPIPGRADYLHYIADLLGETKGKNHSKNAKIRCLDIGVGANCVYPLIGTQEYGWQFVGADIDPKAIKNAQQIIDQNPPIQGKIELRLQAKPKQLFKGIIAENEYFDLTICNPPFHASAKEAQAGTNRKLKNLNRKKPRKTVLNFGGKNNELWCEGGEKRFVANMIQESKVFANSVGWFSTLISKEANLPVAYRQLKKVGAKTVKTIAMGQGNKVSRVLAWRFL